jgi:heme-degrading monooxygenase HmoA
MFVNMGFATPKPGKEGVMVESMHSFAEALKGMPGLIDIFVIAETNGKTIVGVSIWKDKGAFEAAMRFVRPPQPPEPVEQFRTAPPTVRQFESV